MGDQTIRRSKAAATTAWLFAIAGTLTGLALRFTSGSLVGPPRPDVFVIPLIVLAFSTTGLFISMRKPGHTIGILYLLSGVLGAIYWLSRWYSISAKFRGWPGDVAGRVSEQFFYFPWIVATVSLPILLFPDGHLPSPRWRWLRWPGVMFALLLLLAPMTDPDLSAHIADVELVDADIVSEVEGGIAVETDSESRIIETAVATTPAGDLLYTDDEGLVVTEADPSVLTEDGDLVNPLAIDALTMSDPLFRIWVALLTSTLVVLLASAPAALLVRFRNSVGDERQQLKWLVLPAVLAGVGLVAVYTVVEIFTLFDTWWVQTSVLIVLLAVLALPVVTAMAIVRYRLYDIDRLISRTVVYGLLVTLLAGVHLALLFLLSRVLPDGNNLVVALSTLAAAALFNPLRLRIQEMIDRRLYRSSYDAREMVEDLSGRLTDGVDLDTIHDELLDVIDETVKPEAVGVWIRNVEN